MKLHKYQNIDESFIYVHSYFKPSAKKIPKCGTWIVYEIKNGTLIMPVFPEITWGTLNKLLYLGAFYI